MEAVTTKEVKRNYTGYGVEGSNYSKDLSAKDICKIARKELKKQLPNCKFSVTKESYSGGQSIHLSLMSGNFNPFIEKIDNDKLTGGAFQDPQNQINYLERSKKDMHVQINYHSLKDYNDYISSGGILSEKAFNIMKKAIEIIESYNYDDSDGQIDYFDTNFYFHPNVGKWSKPYIITK